MLLNAKTNVEALREIATLFEGEMVKLNKKAEENIPKVMEIGSYPSLASFSWSVAIGSKTCNLNTWEKEWFKFYNGWGTEVDATSQEQLDKRKETILSVIDSLDVAQKKVVEDNKVALENNRLIRDKIILTMEHLGITQQYSVYELPSPRSRKKDWVKKSAGFMSDLHRCVPINIGGMSQNIEQLKEKTNRLYKDALSALQQRERAARKAEEDAKAVHALALIRAKYCPDNAFADADEVLENLLSKNKYLMLAYHLECVRNDWSDGFGMAEYGLSKFVVETPEDQDIYDDIESCFDGFEDGRVFRDTEYGYGFLYSKVEDDVLMNDYRIIKNMLDN